MQLPEPFRRVASSIRRRIAKPMEYDRGAYLALHTASQFCSYFGSCTSPESILLALMHDPVISHGGLGAEANVLRVEKAAADFYAIPISLQRWSAAAMSVMRVAWVRSARRATQPLKVSRGDLLSGLAGMQGLVGDIVHQARVDYAAFDVDLPRFERAAMRPAASDDEVMSVVMLNDDLTPQAFVTEILRERFQLRELRARHLTQRIHLLGGAVVAEMPRARATDAADASRRAARQHGHPLEIQLCRRAL